MIIVSIEADGMPLRRVVVHRLPCRIGRLRDCEVRLDSWRVARIHAQIHRMERGLRLLDEGALSGTWVNGERIIEFGPIDPADEIVISGFRLRVLSADRTAAGSVVWALGDEAGEARGSPPKPGDAYCETLAEEATPRGEPALERMQESAHRPPEAAHRTTQALEPDARPWRVLLHQRLLQNIDLRRKDVRQLSEAQLRADARGWLLEILHDEPGLPQDLDRERLIEDTLDEVVGLGPLQRLMADPEVTEIMVNQSNEIFIEREGRLEATSLAFSSEAAVRAVIERIVAPIGRRIDESSPMVDARLPDGSRVNAIIPPLAIKGSAITIRRFGRQALFPDDLVRLGSADTRIVTFLRQCVQCRQNLLIAGGTGSGKTTLLNLLARFIPHQERLVTVEDAAELSLDHPNLVRLEARPPNSEGRGQVAIRDLVRNALRMRPDRILVGECRGGEALDMLQAMNTGHEGSITTVHANSTRDALARLETMVLMAGFDLPLAAIREQIASAIHVIVHQARDAQGRRRIVEISEVTGTEGNRVLMQPLFRWRKGAFEDCGNVPEFLGRLGLPTSDFMSRASPAVSRLDVVPSVALVAMGGCRED